MVVIFMVNGETDMQKMLPLPSMNSNSLEWMIFALYMSVDTYLLNIVPKFF